MKFITTYSPAERGWLAGRAPWRHLILAALLCILSSWVPQARADELPTGVFSLTPPGKAVNSAILTNSFVSGVSVRWQWQQIEALEGTYNWSYFDREIARVAQAGKKVLLRLVSGGANTPPWVFDTGVQTFSFVDPDTDGSVTVPVWWDPLFLAKKKQLIAAMGQHFADNPAVALVSTSCANATTDDWAVPTSDTDVQRLLAAGYTSEKLIGACQEIIDATLAAFPNQVALMAVNRGAEGLDPNVDYVANAVVDYGMTHYPGRFIVQKNSLSARTPDPWTTSQLRAWKILYDNKPIVAGQMLWYVTNDSACRMNGKTKPCDPVTVLRQAVTIGAHYEMRYEEIYQQDILNPTLADVIAQAADLLSR